MIQSFSCLINKVPNSLLLAAFGSGISTVAVTGVLSLSNAKKLCSNYQWMCCFALDGGWLVPMAGNSCVKGERLKSLVMCFSFEVVREAWSTSTSVGWFRLVSGPREPRSMSVYIRCFCSFTCLHTTKEKLKESENCFWNVGREQNKE